MFKPQHILVTGAAGFIGSHFVRNYLINHPTATIVSLDKLTYAGSREYLAGLDVLRHQLVVGDITDAARVHQLLREHKIDTIVHFAAESHVDRSIQSPAAFIETNINGTFVLLEAARTYWLQTCQWTAAQCRFHHVSTDEVYGSLQADDMAFTEAHPYQPNSPYSASKAASDHLVRAYHHTYGLPITISNCSNNYGPHQHDEKLIPTVIRACCEARAIPMYDSGLNIRDWLYVEDHVDAIACILQRGHNGATYNVGGDTQLTNRAVVSMICDWMDAQHPQQASYHCLVQSVADRAGHDWRYAMNITKISHELGWKPRVAFATGLHSTIQYYWQRYAAKRCPVVATV